MSLPKNSFLLKLVNKLLSTDLLPDICTCFIQLIFSDGDGDGHSDSDGDSDSGGDGDGDIQNLWRPLISLRCN